MGRARWKRWLIAAVKAGVAIVVLWAVGRHVIRTWHDLQRHEVAVQVRPAWLAASGLLYLAGLCCCGRFYEQVLAGEPHADRPGPAVRAYLVSHLGKYVPGKAMVVVMRAGMSVPYGARAATAAIATFYETLVMMAAGGLIAALGFAFAGRSPSLEVDLPGLGTVELRLYHLAGLLGLGAGLAFLVVVVPPVFRRLSRLVSLPFPAWGRRPCPGSRPAPDPGAALVGGRPGSSWARASSRWPAPCCRSSAVEYVALVPVVIASVALATVAGFVVAVLPGGLGVREGVLMYALAPALGDDLAVVAALALRLVWVAAELLAAAVLLPLGPWYRTGLAVPAEAGSSSP